MSFNTIEEVKVIDAKGEPWTLLAFKYRKGELFWLTYEKPPSMSAWAFIHTPVFSDWWPVNEAMWEGM